MLQFSYDLNGQRQAKIERSYGNVVHTTKYFYDGTKLAGEKKDDTIVWYDYDENGAPVGMRVNGLDYIFRKNLQGDITGIYNSSDELIVEYTYSDAWGAGVTVSGSAASTIGMYNSFRYRGYYYDTESGLYYLNSRYYDPVACRFINADELLNETNMRGFNLYSYCFNNPVMYIDPDGTCPYNGTAADFRNLEAGRLPMNCTCERASVESITTARRIDLTYSLSKFMKENREDMLSHVKQNGYISSWFYFKDSVKDGGKWDIKLQPDWNFSPYDKYYFYGQEIRYDAPGNLNYGYVGAGFFPSELLFFMGGVVQVIYHGFKFGDISTYFDDPYDNHMIRCGIIIFKEKLI